MRAAMLRCAARNWLLAAVALYALWASQTTLLRPRATSVVWRPNIRQRRRRHPAATTLLSPSDVLARVPAGGVAFATLANTAYASLAINWALLLQPVLAARGESAHMFLGSLDDNTTAQLLARGLPTLRCGLGGMNATAPTTSNASAPEWNFRLKFSAFRAFGVTKAELIGWLLSAGRHVVISDVDCAWLAPPHGLLSSLPEADVMTGTDCLDVHEDDDRSERGSVVVRCGHHPGATWSAWFNTGVMVWRASAGAIELAGLWRARMAAVAGDGSWGNQVDDQLTFNQLLWGERRRDKSSGGATGREPIYPVRAARADGRVIFAGPRGDHRVAALPARVVCSGHVFAVQQAHARRDCVVMHLTFVEAGVAAKHWRLREAGLYPLAPERVGRPRRFLSFTPPRPPDFTPPATHPSLLVTARDGKTSTTRPIPNMTADKDGWSVATAIAYSPRLAAHLELVDRQIEALRNAMAVARALGRSLLLPRLLCLCERAQSPFAILPSCVKTGASTPLPFVCPLEHLFDVEDLAPMWEEEPSYLELRPWTLLDDAFHPHAAAELRGSHGHGGRATLRWAARRDRREGWDAALQRLVADGDAAAGSNRSTGGGHTEEPLSVSVPRGLSDVQLREALVAAGGGGGGGGGGASEARLLHLESAEAGVFGGFEDAETASEFERRIGRHLIYGHKRFSGSWCCTSQRYQRGTILYKRPAPLPQGAAARDSDGGGRTADAPRQCYWEDCLSSKR